MNYELNSWNYLPLSTVADFENAKAGKKYKEGTFLVPVSACIGRPIIELKEEQEVDAEASYVIVTPKVEYNSKYIFIAFTKQWEKFKAMYIQNINMPYSSFKEMYLQVHKDRATQNYIAKQFEFLEAEIKATEKEIEHIKNMKKVFTKHMFV